MATEIKSRMNGKSIYIISIAAALIHTLISFVWDKGTFVFPQEDSAAYGIALFDYAVCKLLTFIALYFIYRYIVVMIMPGRRESLAYKITLKALPYLAVIVLVAAIKLPQGFLTNDEASIYNDAVNLTHSTWFNILTSYYYTVSLMIAPFKYSPIIFKIIIEFFVIGYIVLRSCNHFGNKIGCISYILFLLYPVIAYTTSAHRLPIYFLLYLLLFGKMFFDHVKKEDAPDVLGSDFPTMIWMLLLGAVLTQWRTEGIYLSVLVPLLMLIVYGRHELKTRSVVRLIAAALIAQAIVAIPQNIFSSAALDDAANDRMKPFWAYTITNMYRNGLDLEANKEDLEIVDKYLSLDTIRDINEHYGDINYEDVLILYQEGFVGVREEATVKEFTDYTDALKRIFINNPGVFMRTRFGAFNYAATPYDIDFAEGGIKGFIKGCISIVKAVLYNLYIPLMIFAVLLVYSLFKKNWFDFFTAGGLICHWFIVFILAPASYFKYYFPVYIMAYFYAVIAAEKIISERLRMRSLHI